MGIWPPSSVARDSLTLCLHLAVYIPLLPQGQGCVVHTAEGLVSSREPRPRPTRSCSCSSSNLPHWAHGLEGRQPLVSAMNGRSAVLSPTVLGTSLGAHKQLTEPTGLPSLTELRPNVLPLVNPATWSIPPEGLFLPPSAGRPPALLEGYSLPLAHSGSPFPPPHATPLPFPLSVHPSGLISTTPPQPSCLGRHCVPWYLPWRAVPGRWQLNTYLELGGSPG